MIQGVLRRQLRVVKEPEPPCVRSARILSSQNHAKTYLVYSVAIKANSIWDFCKEPYMHSKLISVLSWKLYTQNMIRKNVSCAYPCDPRKSEIASSRIERRCAHKTKERRDKNMTRSFDLILGVLCAFTFFIMFPGSSFVAVYSLSRLSGPHTCTGCDRKLTTFEHVWTTHTRV